jgi:hypothetical protein
MVRAGVTIESGTPGPSKPVSFLPHPEDASRDRAARMCMAGIFLAIILPVRILLTILTDIGSRFHRGAVNIYKGLLFRQCVFTGAVEADSSK